MQQEHEIHAHERGANAPGACGARAMWGMRVEYEVCGACLMDGLSETETFNELTLYPDTVVLFRRLKSAQESGGGRTLAQQKVANNAILSVGIELPANREIIETCCAGWWLGHPSEKYEFVNWDD